MTLNACLFANRQSEPRKASVFRWKLESLIAFLLSANSITSWRPGQIQRSIDGPTYREAFEICRELGSWLLHDAVIEMDQRLSRLMEQQLGALVPSEDYDHERRFRPTSHSKQNLEWTG